MREKCEAVGSFSMFFRAVSAFAVFLLPIELLLLVHRGRKLSLRLWDPRRPELPLEPRLEAREERHRGAVLAVGVNAQYVEVCVATGVGRGHKARFVLGRVQPGAVIEGA